MMKMLVVYDEEKIKREKKYDLNKFDKAVKDAFGTLGMYLDDKGYYVGGSFEKFGGIYLSLKKQKWFMENIKEWKLYESDPEGLNDEYNVEDLLENEDGVDVNG